MTTLFQCNICRLTSPIAMMKIDAFMFMKYLRSRPLDKEYDVCAECVGELQTLIENWLKTKKPVGPGAGRMEY